MAKFLGKVFIVVFFLSCFFSMFFGHGITHVNEATIYTAPSFEVILAIVQLLMIVVLWMAGVLGAILLGWKGLQIWD